MSVDAIKRYINPRDGKINVNVLRGDAEALPLRHRNFKSFKESFGDKNYYEHETKNYFIVIDLKYAFTHFDKNTYNDHRSHLNGTLLPTLLDPLIVIKSIYESQNTLTFYKPFKTENNLYNMVMFKVYQEENGRFYFKTIYNAESLYKIDRIIKASDANTLHFKYAEGNGS
jgi:hypothetical protein